MAKKKSRRKAKAIVSNVGPTGVKKIKMKTIVTAAVVVLIVIALLFLFKSGTYFSEAEAETESARPELDLAKVTCLYLGDTPKYGHLGKYFGNVDNNGGVDAENVKVSVEFYNEAGTLVGTHETGIVGEVIPAGDKGSFFSYAEDLTGSFSTCKAKVE